MPNPFAILGPDFFNFLLPWIFTFAVVFGLLAKSKALGENKGVNAAVALVAAFFVTLVGGPQMAAFFSSLFGGASVFLAGIMVVILFITLADVKWKQGGTSGMMVLIVLILVGFFLFIASTGSVVGISISSDLAALIFWLLIIVAIIWLVAYKDGGGAGGGGAAPAQ